MDRLASFPHELRRQNTSALTRAVALPYRLFGYASLGIIGLLICFMVQDLLAPTVPARLINKDFVNYWAAAHLAADGRAIEIFGPQPRYFAQLAAMMGPHLPWHNWSYPPHYLLLVMPLALVNYQNGIWMFLGVTGLLFQSGLAAFMGRRDMLALIAVAPLVIINLFTVQNGFLTSGLILWFLALREKRPILAGVCLGAATIKPQLALLLPILPMIEQRWTLLLSAGLTTVLLVLVSAWAFGVAAWIGFFHDVLPYQAWIMAHMNGAWLTMVPSTFGAMRLLGWSANVALLAHASVAGPVLILAFWRVIAGRIGRRADCLLLISLYLVMPYALNYDLGLMGAALALFIRQEEAAGRPFARWQHAVLLSAMTLPLAMMVVGRTKVDIAPCILFAALLLIVRRTAAVEPDRISPDTSYKRLETPPRRLEPDQRPRSPWSSLRRMWMASRLKQAARATSSDAAG